MKSECIVNNVSMGDIGANVSRVFGRRRGICIVTPSPVSLGTGSVLSREDVTVLYIEG